jgi:hypothetical protein
MDNLSFWEWFAMVLLGTVFALLVLGIVELLTGTRI